MNDKEILAELNKGMIALNKGISGVKQALSSANQAVLQAEAYNKGLEDAWEFVRKTNTARSPQECFGLLDFFDVANYRDIYVEYTPQEALLKLEAYEKEQTEIKAGDVVVHLDTKGVILDFIDSTDDEMVVLNENGCVEEWKHSQCKKTGKHIDIQSVLQQIGGDISEE